MGRLITQIGSEVVIVGGLAGLHGLSLGLMVRSIGHSARFLLPPLAFSLCPETTPEQPLVDV